MIPKKHVTTTRGFNTPHGLMHTLYRDGLKTKSIMLTIDNPNGSTVDGYISEVYRVPMTTDGIIEDIMVSPNYRRQGYARAMIHAALDYLWSRGCTAARLQCSPSNTTAHALYESIGMTREDHPEAWGIVYAIQKEG